MKIKGKLNIDNVGSETNISNLGIDIEGNVVYGVNSGIINEYWTAGTGIYSGSAIITIVNKNNGGISTGNHSIAEGYKTTSTGIASHSEGSETIAERNYSYAEGYQTTASGNYSHAEGGLTMATNSYSHSEGNYTSAIGILSHAEGYYTIANAENTSHAEGGNTKAGGNNSHSQNFHTTANAPSSHSEGYLTSTNGFYSHIGGRGFSSSFPLKIHGFGGFNHSQKTDNNISYGNIIGENSAILGGINGSISSSAIRSVVLGGSAILGTVADTVYVPNLNIDNTTQGVQSLQYYLGIDSSGKVIRGTDVTDSYATNLNFNTSSNILTIGGIGSFVTLTEDLSYLDNNTNYYLSTVLLSTTTNILTFEVTGAANQTVNLTYLKKWVAGSNTYSILTEGNKASGGAAAGTYSVAEGYQTSADGNYSHAEGRETFASSYSHSEGYRTSADGNYSHAENRDTTADGNYSHAEGYQTTASGDYSHAEGSFTTASSSYSHSEGYRTIASNVGSHAGGKGYNVAYQIRANGNASFNHSMVGNLKNSYTSGNASAILGGYNNTINTGAHYSVIIGGYNNTINTNIQRSVILGGNGITAAYSDTVYVPNLFLFGSFNQYGSVPTTFLALNNTTKKVEIKVAGNWTNILFNSYWGNYGSTYATCQSMISFDNTVFLKGLARSDGGGLVIGDSTTNIGTITTAHRPLKTKIFTTMQNGTARVVTITTDGKITLSTAVPSGSGAARHWASLEEIKYRR